MATNSKQLTVGNRDEQLVANLFRKYHFWCHIMAKDASGSQPVDLICLRRNEGWLVDVKNVRSQEMSFPFRRIEPNQLTCMDYASNWAGITNLGFAICFERDDLRPLFLSYSKYMEMSGKGEKSVKMTDLDPLEELL